MAAASCADMVGMGLAARGVEEDEGEESFAARVALLLRPRRQALNARTRILRGLGLERGRGGDRGLDCCCCWRLGLASASSASGVVPDGGEKSMSVCTESQ